MLTIRSLAATTNVDEGDICVVPAWHDHEGDEVPAELFNAVDAMLNPARCRTVPEGRMPDLPPDWREEG